MHFTQQDIDPCVLSSSANFALQILEKKLQDGNTFAEYINALQYLKGMINFLNEEK